VFQRTQTGRRLLNRRLQTVVDDGQSTTQWTCDDTLFECSPICVRSTGVTSTQVANQECAGAPLDACSCSCLYDAAWTCEGDEVVCAAKDTTTLESRVVGDMVCITRGTEKPVITEFEQREAATCEAKPVARGSFPTAQCLEKYTAEKTEREAAALAAAQAAIVTAFPLVKDVVNTVAADTTAAPTKEALDTEIMESVAVPVAVLAAVALFA